MLPVFSWLKRRRRALADLRAFRADFEAFGALASRRPARLTLDWAECRPCLGDRTTETQFDRHYVYHLAWAARVLAATKPAEHTDISSSLHFCSILSSFLRVNFYDYRPASLALSNLQSGRADLLGLTFPTESVVSLSCMHVVEHLGLGRYGDPLDPDADLKAMAELERVLAPNGDLLFVVPIGRPRIVFNAHRIYTPDQVTDSFKRLQLRQFVLIPESEADGGLVESPPPQLVSQQDYGCGCFWFRKPNPATSA